MTDDPGHPDQPWMADFPAEPPTAEVPVPPTAPPAPPPIATGEPGAAPPPPPPVLTDAQLRRDRRPDPRLATALAAAGCGLAISGLLNISGDALDGSGGDGGSQAPGIALSLAILAAGVALLTRAPRGAFHTAGSVATTLSIPSLMFFLTFDDGSFPPYSTEGILAVSAGVWITLHFVGPAAGRTFPLGAGLIAAWLLVLQLIEEPFTSPFDLFSVTGLETFGDSTDSSVFDAPDLSTMGILSLLFGAAMVVFGHRLDRAGQRGRATAFAAAALLMLPVGVLLLADELETVGSGLLLTVIGVVIAAVGALRGRRATNWIGALFVFYGVGTVISDVAGDGTGAFGLSAAIIGAGIVFCAHFLATALGEPDELADGPSTLSTWSVTTPPGSPAEF